MTECELVAVEALGGGVEDAAAQARAQRAVGLRAVEVRRDDRVRVLAQDLERPAGRLEVGAQRRAVVAGLDLIEVDGDQLDLDRQARHELRQQVEQRVALLAADIATMILSPAASSW